jgi:hypothetical protein
MKLKPKAEMKRLAIFNLVIAVILIAGDMFYVPMYVKMSRLNWSQLFRTKPIHDDMMLVLASFIFAIFPTVALFLIRNSRIIFKNLGKILDD